MFSRFLALLGFLIMILKTIMFDLWIFIHKIKRCFFMENRKNVKNGYPKILRKIQFCEFRSIKNSFWSIECSFQLIEEESITDRFRQKLYDEILHCLDQLRIPFDRLNVIFDQSNRNQESIKWGNDFVMNFFIFSIDREKGSTNRRHWILNFHLLFD